MPTIHEVPTCCAMNVMGGFDPHVSVPREVLEFFRDHTDHGIPLQYGTKYRINTVTSGRFPCIAFTTSLHKQAMVDMEELGFIKVCEFMGNHEKIVTMWMHPSNTTEFVLPRRRGTKKKE